MSEEYSKPSLIILTFSTSPIELDCGIIKASLDPIVEDPPTYFGNDLYPDPDENISILLIGPLANNEFVEYFKVSQSFAA